MSRLAVITTGHAPYKGELMEKSAQRVGIEVFRIADGQPWPKDYRVAKLIHGQETVRNLPADVTHVMYVDCSDSLFVGGAEEIIRKFERMRSENNGWIGSFVVVQAEKNCYPSASLAENYPPCETPWKFVNSGGWICHRQAALHVMERVARHAEFCDQLCWSLDFLEGNSGVKLDSECSIFQSMYRQKDDEFDVCVPTLIDYAIPRRLENRRTHSCPCVLHWNGTKNAGTPYSRDGVWELLTGEKPDAFPEGGKKIPTITICMPGNQFSVHWVFGFANLYLEMVKYFGVVKMANSYGNNIYQVRENCIKYCANDPDGPPDYVLWIDSDNPPSAEHFAHLWAAIQANAVVSAIGGWYRFYNSQSGKVMIAAGRMDSESENITEEEILKSEHLIQVPFIGFGLCLMKWQVIADIGIDKAFSPYYFPGVDPTKHRTWATDDAGFFLQATAKGHKTFLHPAVFLEHEKQMNVPASFPDAERYSNLEGEIEWPLP